MEVAIKFWKRLGFDMHSMDNEPQDYGVVSDGQVVLAYLPDGHTSCPALPSPGLLYTTSECGKVERRMKAAGLLATGRKAAPPRDKKDEDSGRVFTLAVPSVHNPTTNKQGELVTCVTPGGVPVVMASNPESKFALYVVAGCALLFFLLLGVVAFAVATSDQARGLLGNILMWIISGGKQGRMGGGGTFAGPSEEAWQRLRDLDPDLARRAARAARS